MLTCAMPNTVGICDMDCAVCVCVMYCGMVFCAMHSAVGISAMHFVIMYGVVENFLYLTYQGSNPNTHVGGDDMFTPKVVQSLQFGDFNLYIRKTFYKIYPAVYILILNIQ